MEKSNNFGFYDSNPEIGWDLITDEGKICLCGDIIIIFVNHQQ